MTNPFAGRSLSTAGPATDLVPVTPADGTDLPMVAVALYVEAGGALSVVTVTGQQRLVDVADHSILPVGIRRVRATGTTAAGIHAMVIA